MKTWRKIDDVLVSLLLNLKRFHTFFQYFIVKFGNWCWLGLPAEIKGKRSKNYETCKDSYKIMLHQPKGSNYNMKRNLYQILKVCRAKALSKYLWNVLRFSFHKNNFFVGNKIIAETSSVAITDSSSVHCIDQYLTCDSLNNLVSFIQFTKHE